MTGSCNLHWVLLVVGTLRLGEEGHKIIDKIKAI